MTSFTELHRSLQKPRPTVLSRMDRKRAGDSEYRRNALIVKQRDSDRCRVCGSSNQPEVHHLVPRSKAGKKVKHSVANLVVLCGGIDQRSCHWLVQRHLIELVAMTDRGTDGPLRVSKFDEHEGGMVTVTEKA